MTISNPNIEFTFRGGTYRLNLYLVKDVITTGGNRICPEYKRGERLNKLWRKKHPVKSRIWGDIYQDNGSRYLKDFRKPRTDVVDVKGNVLLRIEAKNLDEARKNTKRLREIIYTFRGYFS